MHKRCIFIFLIAICSLSGVYAKDKTIIIGLQPYFNLSKYLYFYSDSVGKVDITEAIILKKNGEFKLKESKTNRQEFGFTTIQQWMHFSVLAKVQKQLMLEIEYNNIDYIELYEVINGEVRLIGQVGDNQKFELRQYPNSNYIFPIALKKGIKADYYLYFNQRHSILSFTIELFDKIYFNQKDSLEYIAWGFFIGLILLVMIINLVLLIVTNDTIYFWFLLYVLFMAMHILADAGLAFQFLWPNWPVINSYHPVYLFIWLALVVQVIFMQKFIHQTASNSKIYNILTWFRWFVLACFGCILLFRFCEIEFARPHLFKWVATSSSLFVPIIFVLTMLSLYERKQESEQLVKYYGWAVFVQFIGYLFVAFVTYSQTANKILVLPFDLLSYIIIGTILLIDLLFFSYGLAQRYKMAILENQKKSINIIQEKHLGQQKIMEALLDERKRLSQDLHDDFGAGLSIAKSYLSMLYKNNYHQKNNQLVIELEKASHDIRTISHQLMPANFSQIGLANAIFETINKLNTEIKFECLTYGKPFKLEYQTELMIFTLAYELIEDIIANSHAKLATLQLIYHPNYLNFSIEVDGTYSSKFNRKNLNIMAEFIDSEVIIDTSIQSFSIILKIPTNKKEITIN